MLKTFSENFVWPKIFLEHYTVLISDYGVA